MRQEVRYALDRYWPILLKPHAISIKYRAEYLVPLRFPTCYSRFVNRNIFYIIGVVVVIIIVLKVLHVF